MALGLCSICSGHAAFAYGAHFSVFSNCYYNTVRKILYVGVPSPMVLVRVSCFSYSPHRALLHYAAASEMLAISLYLLQGRGSASAASSPGGFSQVTDAINKALDWGGGVTNILIYYEVLHRKVLAKDMGTRERAQCFQSSIFPLSLDCWAVGKGES